MLFLFGDLPFPPTGTQVTIGDFGILLFLTSGCSRPHLVTQDGGLCLLTTQYP